MFISPACGDGESCLNLHWAKYRHVNGCYGNGEAREGRTGIAGNPGDIGQKGLVFLVRSYFSYSVFLHFSPEPCSKPPCETLCTSSMTFVQKNLK